MAHPGTGRQQTPESVLWQSRQEEIHRGHGREWANLPAMPLSTVVPHRPVMTTCAVLSGVPEMATREPLAGVPSVPATVVKGVQEVAERMRW